MADICDTCAFEDACPSAHFNKTESSICAFYISMCRDKSDGTYWEESIIPIQGRLAELTVLIKAEKSREEGFRLKQRRTALRGIRNELEKTAVYLEHYYRGGEGDA